MTIRDCPLAVYVIFDVGGSHLLLLFKKQQKDVTSSALTVTTIVQSIERTTYDKKSNDIIIN